VALLHANGLSHGRIDRNQARAHDKVSITQIYQLMSRVCLLAINQNIEDDEKLTDGFTLLGFQRNKQSQEDALTHTLLVVLFLLTHNSRDTLRRLQQLLSDFSAFQNNKNFAKILKLTV
jgi:hypothetical protein